MIRLENVCFAYEKEIALRYVVYLLVFPIQISAGSLLFFFLSPLPKAPSGPGQMQFPPPHFHRKAGHLHSETHIPSADETILQTGCMNEEHELKMLS